MTSKRFLAALALLMPGGLPLWIAWILSRGLCQWMLRELNANASEVFRDNGDESHACFRNELCVRTESRVPDRSC